MTANINRFRLGIDMGTNSIGWAAVNIDNRGEPYGVLDMGVRIFPDGRDEQSKTSNTVERRVARGQRRRRDRYLDRRDHLMRKLIKYGLMPADSNARKTLEQLDPYALRAAALDRPLEPHELGRALFHLDQRRGFKSNRKATGDAEKEDGRVRADISLSPALARPGARPRSTWRSTSWDRPRRWARVIGSNSPALATRRWSSKATWMRSGCSGDSI